MANVNELFDKATEESFFVPDEKEKKVDVKDFTPLVEGKYLGHIIKVETRILDVKNWKARLYNYTVRVHDDNKSNKYTYTDIKGDEQTTDGGAYKNMKFRGNVWRFLEPKDGDDFDSNANGNKGYLMFCETIGLECPTETKEINGKKVEVRLLPNLNTNDMLGVPVTAVVKKGRPWKDNKGNSRTYFDCKWVEKWDGGDKITVEGEENEIPF